MRRSTAIICLCLSGSACAQVYKCIDQGKVTYAQAPCPGAQVTQLPVPPAPAAVQSAPSEQLHRQAKLAEQLASARRKREAQDQREAMRARREAAQYRQKCEKLRLRKRWADEDLAGARDSKAVGPLQKKAVRAAEALQVECPG